MDTFLDIFLNPGWHPFDWKPTPIRLGILFCYPILAIGALFVASMGNPSIHLDSREVRFWRGAGGILLLLGLNKSINLNFLLTAWARALARHLGTYDGRSSAQLILLVSLALGGGAILYTMRRTLRNWMASSPLAGAGLLILFAQIAVRTVSWHPIQTTLALDILGWKLKWIVEGGAQCLILAGILRTFVAAKRPRYQHLNDPGVETARPEEQTVLPKKRTRREA